MTLLYAQYTCNSLLQSPMSGLSGGKSIRFIRARDVLGVGINIGLMLGGNLLVWLGTWAACSSKDGRESPLYNSLWVSCLAITGPGFGWLYWQSVDNSHTPCIMYCGQSSFPWSYDEKSNNKTKRQLKNIMEKPMKQIVCITSSLYSHTLYIFFKINWSCKYNIQVEAEGLES